MKWLKFQSFRNHKWLAHLILNSLIDRILNSLCDRFCQVILKCCPRSLIFRGAVIRRPIMFHTCWIIEKSGDIAGVRRVRTPRKQSKGMWAFGDSIINLLNSRRIMYSWCQEEKKRYILSNFAEKNHLIKFNLLQSINNNVY